MDEKHFSIVEKIMMKYYSKDDSQEETEGQTERAEIIRKEEKRFLSTLNKEQIMQYNRLCSLRSLENDLHTVEMVKLSVDYINKHFKLK